MRASHRLYAFVLSLDTGAAVAAGHRKLPKTGKGNGMTRLLPAAGVPDDLLTTYSTIRGRGFFPGLAANQSNPHLPQTSQYPTKTMPLLHGEKAAALRSGWPNAEAKQKKNSKESKISARKTLRKQQYRTSWYKVFIWDFTINTKSSFQCLFFFIQSINLY